MSDDIQKLKQAALVQALVTQCVRSGVGPLDSIKTLGVVAKALQQAVMQMELRTEPGKERQAELKELLSDEATLKLVTFGFLTAETVIIST